MKGEDEEMDYEREKNEVKDNLGAQVKQRLKLGSHPLIVAQFLHFLRNALNIFLMFLSLTFYKFIVICI